MGATPPLDLFEVIEVDVRWPPGIGPVSPRAKSIPTFRSDQKLLDNGFGRPSQDQRCLEAVVGQAARVCDVSGYFSPHRNDWSIIAAKAELELIDETGEVGRSH
jgi:hypothetical protein